MKDERRPDSIIGKMVLVMFVVVLTAFVGKNLDGVSFGQQGIAGNEEKYSFRLTEAGKVTLKITGEIPGKGFQIEIEDEKGREVWRGHFQAGKREYQIGLQKGEYCVRFRRRFPFFMGGGKLCDSDFPRFGRGKVYHIVNWTG